MLPHGHQGSPPEGLPIPEPGSHGGPTEVGKRSAMLWAGGGAKTDLIMRNVGLISTQPSGGAPHEHIWSSQRLWGCLMNIKLPELPTRAVTTEAPVAVGLID